MTNGAGGDIFHEEFSADEFSKYGDAGCNLWDNQKLFKKHFK